MSSSPARTRRAHALTNELLNELLHPAANLVADRPDNVYALTGRVIESPVFVALAGVVRARIAATHGDHDVGSLHRFRRKDLGFSAVMSMPSSAMA